MVKVRRLSPDAHLPDIVDAWLFQLGATKPSPRTLAAYRADVRASPGGSTQTGPPSCASNT